MSNQRIVAGFIVMMNPYFRLSTLMSGISASVTTVASPTAALSQGWCTELYRGYCLDLSPRSDDLN